MSDDKGTPGMLVGVAPEVSLALALHNARGVYAVFLGSGVSAAAEIPTGWNVTLDLIKQIAAASGDEKGAEPDPEAWYRNTYGEEPDYSRIIEELARTPHERRNLLHPYFEPTAEDREEGRKVPTRAHHAVARLAAMGCVKVILTTNFDRLMERALEEAGVDPTTISSTEDIAGASPPQHAGVTLVKINGDYLDSRIRNTSEELASYSPEMEGLLKRIFEEYGLVISGWSGASDAAILETMRGGRSRRYTLYYASRGAPGGNVKRMVDGLQGVVIESAGADELFSDLLERVEALERYGSGDPITAAVAVQRVKRFLDDEGRHVRLRELVVSEARDARTTLFDESSFPLDWRPGPGDPNAQRQQLLDEYRRRVLSHDRSLEAAVGMMAAGGYYASERQARAFAELLEIIATPPEPTTRGLERWDQLRLYPALRLLYAGGVAAMSARNWPVLKAILRDTAASDVYRAKPLVLKVHPWAIDKDHARMLFGGNSFPEPIAEWLYRELREPLEEYLPLDFRYDSAFHGFETILALVQADLRKKEYPGNPSKRDWASLGRFASVHHERPEGSAYSALRAEYDTSGVEWEPIKSGLLEQPSKPGGTPTITTVEHNFDVIDKMITKANYL